jgi:flagella basal body P-ring formation protein FlgA
VAGTPDVPPAVAAEQIVDTARAALMSRLGDDAQRAIVKVVGMPGDVRTAGSHPALHAETIRGAWPRARVSVPVDILVGEKVTSTAMVWFSVALPASGPGYAHDYPAGTDATQLATETVAFDAAAVRDTLQAFHPTPGERLRKAVRQGQPLASGDFEARPDVARGDPVTVTILSGRLRLSATAVANGDGTSGHSVSVLVAGASAPVLARVTGKGEVQVVH